MNGTDKQSRGGRAYRSALTPHFDFIRELRGQRKTWKEIADHLLTDKGIRVTLYAPYLFYKRRLKRLRRPHWEDEQAPRSTPSPMTGPTPTRGGPISGRPPVLPSLNFRRPDPKQFNREDYT